MNHDGAARIELWDLGDEDRAWAEQVLRDLTAGPTMVSRGRLHDGRTLPGIVAWRSGRRIGLALYEIVCTECEVVFVGSEHERLGAGSALLEEVARRAAAEDCERVWLVTTNDNTPAIRFYQRHGWDLAAVHLGAIDESRRLKPTIPRLGHDDIPMRHEVELERRLRS